MQPTFYQLSQKYTHSEFLSVKIFFQSTQNSSDLVQLPAWRPGRYQLGNFSQNVRNFKVTDKEGKAIAYSKKDRNSWLIEKGQLQEYVVSYEVYTHKIDGGSTYVNEALWYLNPINCLMYQPEKIDHTCEVQLSIPSDWEIATSLERNASNLSAKSFYDLVDSPIVAAKEIQHLSYKVKDVQFHLWIHGNATIQDKDQLLSDFKAFTEEQVEMMGDFETKDYHFLLMYLDHKAYHGVEHLSSTCIVLGPAKEFNDTDLYDNLLGISSHELFHYWNIIRIRPAEMYPYNFGKENYFPTGFVAEGVTTYYGDLFLVRSHVRSLDWYINELNKLFKRHFENYGRLTYSLADSSRDLWVDGYEAGTPNRKVSIYVKGAIISMILDLRIILATNADRSLDDVLRSLYYDFYKKGKGYTQEDYLSIAEEVGGFSLEEYKVNYIEGLTPVEEELTNLLAEFGFELIIKENEDLLARFLGVRSIFEEAEHKVTHTAIDSLGESLFRLDDKLVAVNNKAIDDLKKEDFVGELSVQYWRNGKLKECKTKVGEQTYYQTFELKALEELNEIQKRRLNKWLKIQKG